jgi:hypothetical protein
MPEGQGVAVVQRVQQDTELAAQSGEEFRYSKVACDTLGQLVGGQNGVSFEGYILIFRRRQERRSPIRFIPATAFTFPSPRPNEINL